MKLELQNDSAAKGEIEEDLCVGRRDFLLFAGATVVGLSSVGVILPAGLGAQPVGAKVAGYPEQTIGSVRALADHAPTTFLYPFDHPHCSSMLVKLGTPAGGGVGPNSDIVAFNQLCTHQGGLLEGQYQSEYRVLGPCPIHLTTFDLARHGMVVSGHATQGLPQVLLRIEGDAIIATGVMGLIYGYSDNRAGA